MEKNNGKSCVGMHINLIVYYTCMDYVCCIDFQFVDIDECSSGNAHGCNQVCTNTPGSYLCSCYNCSYQISNDGKTCTGTELDLMELF